MDAAKAEERRKLIITIQQAVADLFSMSVEKLCEGRDRSVSIPRQIAMFLAKQLTDASLPEIGVCFGGRHHTTVMHAIAKIHHGRLSNQALDHMVSQLLAGLDQHS